MVHTYITNFDTKKFDFRSIIIKHLCIENIEELHKNIDNISLLNDYKTDQNTHLYKELYTIFDKTDFLIYYTTLVHDLVFDGNPLVYQKKPTFRIHLPDNLAVADWHKDDKYGHQDGEINYWLPFTDTFDTNTIWIESGVDTNNYQPYSLKYGEILVFDGVNLRHGNKINQTGITRISMDFRAIPLNQFTETNQHTSSSGLKMSLNSYFELMK